MFTVRVFQRRLWVLGRLDVARVLDYGCVGEHLPMEDYARLLRWRPLKAGCVTEVLIGPPGTPLSFDCAVPPDLLDRITLSRRGERQIKHVVDGELTHASMRPWHLPARGVVGNGALRAPRRRPHLPGKAERHINYA